MRARSALAAGLLAAGLVAVPGVAHAASRVTVTNQYGKAQADPHYLTKLTLHGNGFQAIKNGHGGIYVFFGTVNGTWRPSQGGVTGANYLYVPDTESRNNEGYQRFIAFEGSDTASAARGVIAADGSWSTTINVPGAAFEAVDRDGGVAKVDCRKVTCGIITIGAHGVVNPHNESFTPVSFADLYTTPPSTPAATTRSSAPAATATSSASTRAAVPTTSSSVTSSSAPTAPRSVPASAPAAPAASSTAKVDAAAAVDADTAVVGRVLSFTGKGFRPGEQVTASFDDGRAAVGPLPAGAGGEVGGVLALPADTRAGTHTLRLTGAASGVRADVNFPVTADAEARALTAVTTTRSDSPGGWAFLGAAIAVLAAAVLFAGLRIRWMRAARGGRADA